MTTVKENLTRDEARARARAVHDVAYDVALDLTHGDEHFSATTTITFTAEAGTSTFLDCTAHRVHSVTVDGEPLDVDDVVEPTRILLADLPAAPTVVVHATMAYQHEGRGMHHFRDPSDGRVYLHSQFEPFDAHLVFACFDQPDLKARTTMAVTAPADWVVVANTEVVDRPAEGEAGTWTFAPTPPLSTYVLAVVAGQYVSVHDSFSDEHGEIPLGVYVRPELLEHLELDELVTITRQGLAWCNDNFGLAYPFGKYDQLFVPEFSAGAMENPGCVTFSESYVCRGAATDAQRHGLAETLLHEMAHMWFGDLVTMRWWDDLWLNESFADFAAVLSLVEATRFDNGWVAMLDETKAWAKYQDQLPSTHPIAADMPDIQSVHQNFDGITYAKGASVLRQLVAWVGQDDFLAALRGYFERHQYDNAELADLLAALEAASGRDLATWRDAWLTTSGINTMRLDVTVDDDNVVTAATLHQGAEDDEHTLRPHRMAIGVYDEVDGSLARTARIELDVAGAETSVTDLVGRDAGRLFVVNDDDLTYTKVELDPRTRAVVADELARVADPMPRALLWAAAWDMVRDATMAASQYVHMVETNIGAEPDVGVLTRTLQRAEAAAVRYGDPARRDEVLARLAERCWRGAQDGDAGPDHQLAWVRQYARTATTTEQLRRLARLHAGDLRLDGVEVDQDLGWRLVVALARGGAWSGRDIDRALADDDSDFGRRHAATARAAMPSAAAKQAAWDLLLGETGLSHTMSRQVWGGFQQLTQPELVRPWVGPYFDALDTVWAERSTEWCVEFARGMFPQAAASTDLADRAGATLARDDLPGPLRRVVAEQLDTVRRTIRARALDTGHATTEAA